MKLKNPELVQELLKKLAPQLRQVVPAGQEPSRKLLQAIQQLAVQLERAREKKERQALKALNPSLKKDKQKLTNDLTALLTSHFSEGELAEKETILLTETAHELAEKFTKLRTRHLRKKKDVTPVVPLIPPVDEPAPAKKHRTPRTARRSTDT